MQTQSLYYINIDSLTPPPPIEMNAQIYICDASSDIELNYIFNIHVHSYSKAAISWKHK